MKSCVIVFPASNCDRDTSVALEQATGQEPTMVWHGETSLPETDLIVVPGGFSYGDYLRSGAMAARSPIMQAVKKKAAAGVPIIGICNGFQILTEAGLLPGALMRNQGLEFVCGMQGLQIANNDSAFTRVFDKDQHIEFPVAHHDGNYMADEEILNRLDGEGRVAFRYLTNPNGSARNIAGITNETGTILGLMPHPERVISPLLGGEDGAIFFRGLVEAMG